MARQNGIEPANEIQVQRLISAFSYDFEADFAYDGEKHSGWEFVYVESGQVCVNADDFTYILKSGEMVCHKPYEFHCVQPYRGPVSVIIFCFECDSAEMQFFNNKIITVLQRQKQYLHDIAEHARSVFAPKHPLDIVRDGQMDRPAFPPGPSAAFHEQSVKNTIELLILSLIMNSETTERRRRGAVYALSAQRQTLTADIIKYLQEHLAEPIHLTELSRCFSYSLSSIKRIFKEETGCGIIEYLNNLRVDEAAYMLTQSACPVAEIARYLGFSNVYYFSNVFKKKTGKSPSAYRKAARAQTRP